MTPRPDADLIREDEVERLSALFHMLYQEEAKRQGDVRHPDDYYALPENVKEFDRVLARYVLAREQQLREELAVAKWSSSHWESQAGALFAQVQQLREALERVEASEMGTNQAHEIAREALAAERQENTSQADRGDG